MKKCPQCGREVGTEAVRDLCPECLLKAGLGTLTGDSVAASPHAFAPPSVEELAPLFPALELVEFVGRGGMGAVYKARQKDLDRVVALKILPPSVGGSPAFAERFAREAKALARLNHPNVVTLYEFGRAGGEGPYYFLMEFVDGVSLGHLLRGGRISAREALAIVPQICDALQYAHDHGIVHRDIKPENILLDRLGRVKVADFGLAKIVGTNAAGDPAAAPGAGVPAPVDATAVSRIMGTPQYMAPEQRERPAEVDHRADIYSLGVVFYQMLTGELPKGDLAPPSRKVAIDVRLDEVVLRALEGRPERRYQQVGDVKTMCETISGAPAGGGRVPPRKTGMTRLLETFFDTTFSSPTAIRLANLSALGFLGSLGFLHVLPLPGWERCAGFFGLFGIFGLIGVAVLVELLARAKASSVPNLGSSAAPPAATRWLGFAVFVSLYLALTLGVLITASWLPERVATHFGADGRADGWMSRGTYLVFTAAFPLALAALFAGIAALIRVLPARFVNLPNRDYWLAPERRASTADRIRDWVTGLLCLMTLFFAGLHALTVVANRSAPPQLPMGGLMLLVIAFLLALMLWLTVFLMRFAEIGPAGGPESPAPGPGKVATPGSPTDPARNGEGLEKAARASRYGKLALTLCFVGLALPGLLFALGVPPDSRFGILLWLGALGVTSLCEIAALVLGIVGWKSGAGKAAVIVAVLLPFLVVPGAFLFYRAVHAMRVVALKEDVERVSVRSGGGTPPRVQGVLRGERDEWEKRLRAALLIWLNEAGAAGGDLQVAVADDLTGATVRYRGLKNFKLPGGAKLSETEDGSFQLKANGESEWEGMLHGVRVRLHPYAIETVGLVVDGDYRPVADVRLRQQNGPWNASTDADGRFALPMLANNQQISLAMQAHGFAKRENVSLFRDAAGWSVQPVRFMMRRTARLSGRVLAPNGKPLAYAPLSLMTCHGPYRDGDRTGNFRSSGASGTTANALRAVTDDQGNWHMEDVPAGCHILYYPWEGPTQDEVEQGRWRALQRAGQEVPLKGICGALVVEAGDGAQVDNLVLDLGRSTCRIAGRVLDPRGQPVAGAALGLFRRAEKSDGTDKVSFGAGLTGNADAYSIPKTDADGRYEIRNFPPGDWRVRASLGKVASEGEVRLTAVGEAAKLDLCLTNSAPAGAAAARPATKTADRGEPRAPRLGDRWPECRALYGAPADGAMPVANDPLPGLGGTNVMFTAGDWKFYVGVLDAEVQRIHYQKLYNGSNEVNIAADEYAAIRDSNGGAASWRHEPGALGGTWIRTDGAESSSPFKPFVEVMSARLVRAEAEAKNRRKQAEEAKLRGLFPPAADAARPGARLQFRFVAGTNDADAVVDELPDPADPTGRQTLRVCREVVLDDSAVGRATVETDAIGGPQVLIAMTPAGTRRFAEITGANIGRQLAIVLDGKVQSAPVIREAITGGKAMISGRFTAAEAAAIAKSLDPRTRVPAADITQEMVKDLQPDGTIRFRSTVTQRNIREAPLTAIRFSCSDFVQMEKMFDGQGRPMAFESHRTGASVRYDATLPEPVPAGAEFSYVMEGTETGLVRRLSRAGEFQYISRHWPATPGFTRRTETHRLPAGARLLDTTPADLGERSRDGRIEVYTDRTIPGGGSLEIGYRWMMKGD